MNDDTTSDDTTSDDTTSDDTTASSIDAVGAVIAVAADAVDVGDPATMLATVRSTVGRRRRRRNAVVGLAAAGTLVVSGVVIANAIGGDDGDELLVSAPATEAPTSDPEDTDDTDTPPVTDVGGGSPDVVEVPGTEVVPVQLVPAAVTDVVDPGVTIDAASGGDSRLLPWKDGFLSIRTIFGAQRLPGELAPEITDQFPPEVVELFPDGLPDTMDEAIDVLEDAGLLDEVTQIVTANQDVSDAIYSEPAAVTTSVRFSTDGIEWTDVDADFPTADGMWSQVASTGDRLAVAVDSGVGVPARSDAAEPAPPRVVEIYSSTDLVDWSVQTVPLPDRSAELDPRIRYETFVSSLAVNENGFIVSTHSFADVDVVELLEPELRDRARASGVSVGTGDDGVTIEFYDDSVDANDADGSPDSVPTRPVATETYTYTWAELGFETAPQTLSEAESATWVSTWDGTPFSLEGPTEMESGIFGVGGEFVAIGPTARWSPDGVDWTPIDLPGSAGHADAAVEASDGVAIRVSDETGRQATYEGDLATGEWTLVETPELPGTLSTEASGTGAFVLAAYGDEGFGGSITDAVGSRSTAEVGGYRYELETTHTEEEYGVTYTLTDIATGEVVVTESADGLTPDEDPFLYVLDGFGGSTLTIVDPETGEPLVAIPWESMTQEIVTADGTVIDTTETVLEPGLQSEATWPSYWVMASLGDAWMVEQVSDGTEASGRAGIDGRWPSGVVVAGDIALVGWADGSFTRIAPE